MVREGTLGFGLIGYGAWGRHHGAAIAGTAGATLAAVATRTAASLDAARAAHPDAFATTDYRALLARPDVDVVDVVLPGALHEEVAVGALEAGKHVLLEKPMATTRAGCDRLLAAARAAGRVLSVGHEFRLSSQWGRIKALIDAGRLGEPLHVLVSLWRRPYRGGSGGWRYDRHQVGSWILEEPVHFVDLALWYCAVLGDPVTVFATGNSKGRGDGMYDNFSAVLRWPGGAYAVINQVLAGFEHHQTVEVVGTRGAVRATWAGAMDRTREARATLRLVEGLTGSSRFDIPEPVNVALDRPSGELFELEEEIRRMVESVRTGVPFVSGQEARRAVLVCLAAEESARLGREVPLSLG